MSPTEWLTLNQAAKLFGYKSVRAFTNRIRQLRVNGYVLDTGNPPGEYATSKGTGAITLLWANPQACLIQANTQTDLLDPKKGRRKQPIQPAPKIGNR